MFILLVILLHPYSISKFEFIFLHSSISLPPFAVFLPLCVKLALTIVSISYIFIFLLITVWDLISKVRLTVRELCEIEWEFSPVSYFQWDTYEKWPLAECPLCGFMKSHIVRRNWVSYAVWLFYDVLKVWHGHNMLMCIFILNSIFILLLTCVVFWYLINWLHSDTWL